MPVRAAELLGLPLRPYHGIGLGTWAALAVLVLVVMVAFGGLGRGRAGYAWVLSLFGDYRGTVRRSGLVWVSPLLLRRRIDVRLRHWRSEPMDAVDANGVALRVVVLVVWQIRDTARAMLAVEDHTQYLREQVEAAMARVLSQLPADAFHDTAPTLRDAEAVGDALTRMLAAEAAPVGIDIFSAQPTRIEYAPEIAAAMRRRQVAALDARQRDSHAVVGGGRGGRHGDAADRARPRGAGRLRAQGAREGSDGGLLHGAWGGSVNAFVIGLDMFMSRQYIGTWSRPHNMRARHSSQNCPHVQEPACETK